MSKQIVSKRNIKRFTDQCFDRESELAARIIKGVLDVQSPRISDIANAMDGNYDGNYKAIQRFIEDDKPEEALHRLQNRGRAIPFSFITYSSRTIGAQLSSRNMKHIKSIAELKELLGNKILVLDREFSYELLVSGVSQN
jgi:hypothetical protein